MSRTLKRIEIWNACFHFLFVQNVIRKVRCYRMKVVKFNTVEVFSSTDTLMCDVCICFSNRVIDTLIHGWWNSLSDCCVNCTTITENLNWKQNAASLESGIACARWDHQWSIVATSEFGECSCLRQLYTLNRHKCTPRWTSISCYVWWSKFSQSDSLTEHMRTCHGTVTG